MNTVNTIPTTNRETNGASAYSLTEQAGTACEKVAEILAGESLDFLGLKEGKKQVLEMIKNQNGYPDQNIAEIRRDASDLLSVERQKQSIIIDILTALYWLNKLASNIQSARNDNQTRMYKSGIQYTNTIYDGINNLKRFRLKV